MYFSNNVLYSIAHYWEKMHVSDSEYGEFVNFTFNYLKIWRERSRSNVENSELYAQKQYNLRDH